MYGGGTEFGKTLSKDPLGLNRWINPVDFWVSDTPEILALFQEEMLTSVTLGLVINISMIEFLSLTVKSFIFNMFVLYLNDLSLQIVFNLLDTLAH